MSSKSTAAGKTWKDDLVVRNVVKLTSMRVGLVAGVDLERWFGDQPFVYRGGWTITREERGDTMAYIAETTIDAEDGEYTIRTEVQLTRKGM